MFQGPGSVVRKEGLEPPYPFGYQILSLARLPVPPLSLRSSVSRRVPLSAVARTPFYRVVRKRRTSVQPASGYPARRVSRGFRLMRAESILVGTPASAMAFTLLMISSLTGPRADARELIARRAGTGFT
jgi:hypothetical protein